MSYDKAVIEIPFLTVHAQARRVSNETPSFYLFHISGHIKPNSLP